MANVYKSINEGFLRKYGDLDVAPKKALKESVEKEKTEVVEAKEAEKLTGNAAKLKKAFPELNFGKSELKEDLKEDKIEELKIKIHDNPEAAALVKHILEILEECEDCKEEAEEEEEETEETEEAEKEELTERWNHWYRLYVILGEDKEPIGADEFENIPEEYYDVKSESEAIKKAKQLHKLIKENNFEELKDFIGVQVVEILNDGDEFKTEAIYQTNEEAEKEELNESGIAVGKESAEDLAVNGEETIADTANKPAVKPAVIIIKVESSISADGFEVTVKGTDGSIIDQRSFRYGYNAAYSRLGVDKYRPFVTDIINRYLSKYNLNKDNIIVTKGRNVFNGKDVSDEDITDFKTKYLGSHLDESKNESLKENYGKRYKESTSKEKTIKEDLAQDLTRYQKWVDYDMKKYGRISDITKRALEKASLELVKDDHGDYEVIAKEDDGKAIAESVAKRGGIGKRK